MKKNLAIILILAALCACAKKGPNLPGQLKPGSPEYIMNQGLYYLNEGNLAVAESKLEQALKKKPGLEGALNGLGLVYMYKQEFDRAISTFEKLLRLNPKHADAHNSLGLIHTEKNRYDKAKEHLLVAANMKNYKTPENAYVNLANLELRFNNLAAAQRYIEKALQANDRFAPVFNVLGIIAERRNQLPAALKYYERAQSILTHDDINLMINVGRVQAKMGHKRQALDILERALALAQSEVIKDHIRATIKKIEL